MKDYKWLEKRTPRSIEQLRLWPENPRLSPDDSRMTLFDFISDLLSDNSEKDSFIKLVDSIVQDGFIPADPIVVWQDPINKKYYVAEGNRRVLVLKLLKNPEKCPKKYRPLFKSKTKKPNISTIEKINVCVAPSFDECEWYINQRHSTSSLQRKWSRLQQQKWIADLYDKYAGDIDTLISITKFSKGELDHTLRILRVRDVALNPVIYGMLSDEVKACVNSHKIPMTIFERWFFNSRVKECWGVTVEVDKVVVKSDLQSFLLSLAKWLTCVIHRDDSDVEIKINTRTIDNNLEEILNQLPKVEPSTIVTHITQAKIEKVGEEEAEHEEDAESDTGKSGKKGESKKPNLAKDPYRPRLIMGHYSLQSKNYKIKALFGEFKKIPFSYKTCISASLRVFLDLAVEDYISENNLQKKICDENNNKNLYDIELKKKLRFLEKCGSLDTPAKKVIGKLVNKNNEFSLDTLNSYIHGSSVHHIDKSFLNRFWDAMFPLLSNLVTIEKI